MFQAIFEKLYEFRWWDMERNQTDSRMQFTSKEFQEGISVCGVRLALASSDHQEMNGRVELTWRTLINTAH